MSFNTTAKKRVSIEECQKIVDQMFTKFPNKTKEVRKRHVVVIDQSKEKQRIEANDRAIPGVLTNRGCAYAGCKGVVFGPVKDVLHITHGPVGCAYYTWLTRRNLAKAEEGQKNFINYCLTTDMQETDIVFGGEKKLAQAIREAYAIFKPECVGIYATCPVGLIGDDIEMVAKKVEQDLGIKVIPVRCEGYRGVSQSAGHHLASNALMEHLIGTEELENPGPFDINVFGEYNIGGDYWEIKRLLEDIGYRIVSSFTGDASFHDIAKSHRAKLSILLCHRSINYTNRMMEEKFGVPWMKVNYIGIDDLIQSLRDIANFFDDPGLKRRTEEVIARELERIIPIIDYYRERLQGKRVMLLVGGSRTHHFKNMFERLGMEVVVAGYEFAHRDDYEGRKIIPEIVHTGRSKILEDIHYERDPNVVSAYDDEYIQMKKEEIPRLMDYEGLRPHMKDGEIMVDDYNHFECEYLVKELGIDLFCSGIKDKYVFQKMHIPSRQMHSYDYSGPYTGFNGFIKFARDVDMAVNSPTWSFITPPWKEEKNA
ncbi:nitrogenase molybdenum-iron protein alpha chain [Caldanaerobius polysaccharolyticus]|uniref:nitrogenase molybdenum-iron protein alpha chain n=1 Tax=Caldanaerobius polysaccharolyticus TaxID=44256 RepID=UPI0012EB35D3|nr:nitrogenase molybdenum-iron protein alpha chain [Caldanaerobius polysaccharolyticus]